MSGPFRATSEQSPRDPSPVDGAPLRSAGSFPRGVPGVRRLHLWLLLAILLLAFGLRLTRLGAESLWYDETVSAHLAAKSLPDLVAHTAGDIHPPGYYALLHAWTRLAGSSDFALAFPSLAFGLLLVALACRLGTHLFGARAGLLAAFLVAISPYNVWYSQEVRMYTLGAVLGMGVLMATLSLVDAPVSRRTPITSRSQPPSRGRHPGDGAASRVGLGWLAVYAACGALGLWTLYYFAFLLVAVNGMVAAWWLASRRRGDWGWLGRWALAQAAVLLLYAPWIPTAWRQVADPPVPPWRGFTGLGDVLAEVWSALCLGQSVEVARVWPVLLLFALLFGLGLLSKRLRPPLPGRPEEGGTAPWLLAGYVFFPVLLIYGASFITPLYHVRYAFTYSTPFYIIVGAGLAWLWGRWRPAAWLGLAVVVLFSGLSLYAYHTDPHYAGDDHRAAAQFLARRWRPGDAVLVNAGYAYTALATYWDGDPVAWQGRLVGDGAEEWAGAAGRGVVVLQTGTVGGDPSLGWGDPASDFYAMDRAETAEALARLFDTVDRLWVYRIYDTVVDEEGVIRDWLGEHGTPFEDQTFTGEGQLRVQGYLTGRDPQAGGDLPPSAGLADGSLRLAAMAPLPASVEAGGALDLALVWEVGSIPGDGEILLFAGLFDEAGRRWAQVDERPLGTAYPVAAWPGGATVRTPLRLPVPPDLPPGTYRLEVGWYRFVDGQPLWVPWASGDRLVLGAVDVVPPQDWDALPAPQVAHPVGVTVGSDVRLLGFDAPSLEALPGGAVDLELVWQALADGPQAGLTVLRLRDDAGAVLAEVQSAPAGGRAPFAQLAAGQAVRDPWSIPLPGDLPPGAYTLEVGRRRADGTWLPVARGPFPLGTGYPLATVRILGRPLNLDPPAVGHPAEARFGACSGARSGGCIRLVGYDLDAGGSTLGVVLHWQALAPVGARYKIFVHLVGGDEAAGIAAQADDYPRLPTTSWLAGEYLRDEVAVDLPPDLPPGEYELWLGFYDEATGARLPVFDAAGEPLGDRFLLERLRLGDPPP